MSLVLFFSFLATHDCFAETVEWKDFTKPLNLGKYKLTSTNPLTIDVHIPAEVLKKFAKLPLILKGNKRGYEVTLRVNDNPWAFFRFPEDLPANYSIRIKTKHLKPGVNKLYFMKNHHTALGIYSLQFNLGKAEKGRTKKIKTQSTAKTSKSTQQIPQPSKPPTDTIAEKDKFKIAVMEFKSLNPGSKTTNLGSMISEMFTTEVVNNNSFKIVEREQLNKNIGRVKNRTKWSP